jgi:hypothetical protein
MKRSGFALLLVLSLVPALPAWANDLYGRKCEKVGGVLFTNINAIALPSPTNGTNLGQVWGDLQGSLAATILGSDGNGGFMVQHYWVTSSGDTIKFKPADLHPATVTPFRKSNPAGDLVAVPWGAYTSEIDGGTGKYAHAQGKLSYFGLADFTNLTLVLRYRGEICYDGYDED